MHAARSRRPPRAVALAIAIAIASPARGQDLGALVDEPKPAPPAQRAPDAPVASDAAAAIRETLQLAPEEIRALKAQAAGVGQALAIPPGAPPRPMTSSVPVKLSPGHPPPTLFLASGMVANATFLDATGAAWPVERWSASHQGGQASTFEVTQLGVNILSVSSAKLFAVGNIAIKLQDLDTPVAITLAQGASRVVDYNKEFQLPGRGPLAKPAAAAPPAAPEIEPELYDFLDGIPPAGAQPKRLVGGSGAVWLFDGMLYLKTTATLISPAWQNRAGASDGTIVYKLFPIPVLVLSDRGRELRAHVR